MAVNHVPSRERRYLAIVNDVAFSPDKCCFSSPSPECRCDGKCGTMPRCASPERGDKKSLDEFPVGLSLGVEHSDELIESRAVSVFWPLTRVVRAHDRRGVWKRLDRLEALSVNRTSPSSGLCRRCRPELARWPGVENTSVRESFACRATPFATVKR